MVLKSSEIKILRDKTGAGMMDCKKALEETSGNIEKAIEWLRKNGINTAQKKLSRDASDGLITVKVKKDSGIIIEINAETDFVARNEYFQEFCKQISEVALEKKIRNINDLLEFKSKDSKLNIKDEVTNIISKLGENIIVKRLKLLNNNNSFFQKYLHNSVNEDSGKIGVLLGFECSTKNELVDEFSKNIAMHIAASEPRSLTKEKLDKKIIESEKSIYKEQLINSGKPDEIIDKIVLGKLNKFFDEVCLMEQYFVMDNKTKINDCIKNFNKENNLDFKIQDYCMFKLGQI